MDTFFANLTSSTYSYGKCRRGVDARKKGARLKKQIDYNLDLTYKECMTLLINYEGDDLNQVDTVHKLVGKRVYWGFLEAPSEE